MSTSVAIKKENNNLSVSGKPTTLNKEKRKILIELSKNIVNVDKEKTKYEEHLKIVSKVITETLKSIYPQDEMKILFKYNKANNYDSVCFQTKPEGNKYSYSLGRYELTENLILTKK